MASHVHQFRYLRIERVRRPGLSSRYPLGPFRRERHRSPPSRIEPERSPRRSYRSFSSPYSVTLCLWYLNWAVSWLIQTQASQRELHRFGGYTPAPAARMRGSAGGHTWRVQVNSFHSTQRRGTGRALVLPAPSFGRRTARDRSQRVKHSERVGGFGEYFEVVAVRSRFIEQLRCFVVPREKHDPASGQQLANSECHFNSVQVRHEHVDNRRIRAEGADRPDRFLAAVNCKRF